MRCKNSVGIVYATHTLSLHYFTSAKNSTLDFTGFFCTIQNFLVTAASILDTESLAI